MKSFPIHVWVRLQNFSLRGILPDILEDIGDSIEHLIKVGSDQLSKGFVNFVRLCVEVELNEGLPDKIVPKQGYKEYSQPLDYENTTFKCGTCQQSRYLQHASPFPKGIIESQELKRNNHG